MALPKIIGSVLADATPRNVFNTLDIGATFNIRVTNKSDTTADAVTLSLSTVSGAHDGQKFLVRTELINPGKTLELTGIAVDETHRLVASCDGTASLAVVAYGLVL